MFWLAAKLLFIGTLPGGQAITDRERAAWEQVRPSVVTLRVGPMVRGTAALVSAQGWFVTQNTVVSGAPVLQGQFYDGTTVNLTVVKVDPATQLALLKSDIALTGRPAPSLYTKPDTKVDADHPVPLIAVLPSGPIRAELVATNYLGLLHSSRAATEMSEIQFESPTKSVNGVPVFSLDGALVGVLQATLGDANLSFGSALAPKGGYGAVPNSPPFAITPKRFGPASMTVAYSPSPETMQHVISGFLTPEHEVQRPAIGVFCRNAAERGALVESVLDGSPADQAGIRRGDIIVTLAGQPVRDAIAFGKVMLQQKVGSIIIVVVKREGQYRTFSVKVGLPDSSD